VFSAASTPDGTEQFIPLLYVRSINGGDAYYSGLFQISGGSLKQVFDPYTGVLPRFFAGDEVWPTKDRITYEDTMNGSDVRLVVYDRKTGAQTPAQARATSFRRMRGWKNSCRPPKLETGNGWASCSWLRIAASSTITK
jgi:hypothetical protein